MYKFSTLRLTRAAIGLAAVSAFALAPMAAQADGTTATGTLTAGALSEVAPAITPFTAALTGITRTVSTPVGTWNLTDAVGDGAAYNISVTAGAPTIAGTSIAASLGSTWLSLTPTTATADPGNPVLTAGPTAVATPVALGTAAATIDHAAVNTGAGQWDFPAGTVAVTIPGDAAAGAYSDLLTYTIAAGVGT
jgi:hypothetical protein